MPVDETTLLREQLDTAHERIRQLEELLAPRVSFPVEWRLTPTEAKLLAALIKRRGLVATESLLTLVYDDPDGKTVRDLAVVICKVRKKLRPQGVTIFNVWAQGFGLDEESRAIVLRHIGGTDNT